MHIDLTLQKKKSVIKYLCTRLSLMVTSRMTITLLLIAVRHVELETGENSSYLSGETLRLQSVISKAKLKFY